MSDGFIDELRAAHERAAMVGWDFSRLDDERTSDDPWWDFEADCLEAARGASRIVDLGTAGGERLLRLVDELEGESLSPWTIAATEGWEPNLAVARENLAPRSIDVRRYDAEAGEPMPFPDESLDLVMSRHEAFDATEIARVLSRGGRLLTQQVEARDAEEIHEWFGTDFLYPDATSAQCVRDLEAAGMRIDAVDDWRGAMEFAHARALVTYLGLVPWDAPGFVVDEHAERLVQLDASRPIRVTQRRFRVYATKT